MDEAISDIRARISGAVLNRLADYGIRIDREIADSVVETVLSLPGIAVVDLENAQSRAAAILVIVDAMENCLEVPQESPTPPSPSWDGKEPWPGDAVLDAWKMNDEERFRLQPEDAEGVARDIDFCLGVADYGTARTQLHRLIELLSRNKNEG